MAVKEFNEKMLEKATGNASAVIEKILSLAEKTSPGLSEDTASGNTSSSSSTNGNTAASNASVSQTLITDGYSDNGYLSVMKKELLENIMNNEEFSYDMNNDALYKQYKDLYTAEGQRYAEHIYGLNSALTGGYGNSYASSAAAAAYGEYMSALSEKAAELEQNAYERYVEQKEDLLDKIKLVEELSENDYSKYRDSVEDYFDSEELELSKRNQTLKENQYKTDLASERYDTALSLALKAANYGDFSLLENLGVDTSSYQEDMAFELALKKAELGDYSALSELGVDVKLLVYKEVLELAEDLAELGDYSALKSMGIDVSSKEQAQKLELALSFAKLGDYTLLEQFGFNVPEEEAEEEKTEKISISVQKGAAEAYESGGITALEKYLSSQVAYGQISETAKQTIINTMKG